jgi:hypothetical protein
MTNWLEGISRCFTLKVAEKEITVRRSKVSKSNKTDWNLAVALPYGK